MDYQQVKRLQMAFQTLTPDIHGTCLAMNVNVVSCQCIIEPMYNSHL
jgi:hypothetical protein